MDSFDAIDAEAIVSGVGDWIGTDLVAELARHPLDCIDTEYPHYVGSVEGPDALEPPATDHPVFYGCFDWHSAVHSHWCLVRQLRLFADHPRADEIETRLSSRFTPEAVEGEVAYLDSNPTFERPYGWAWLLRLAAELAGWSDDRADRWREILQPLESRVVDLVEAEFPTQERPFRVGTHGNSAFALSWVLDYARVASNAALEAAVLDTARSFYLDDRDYPVGYEPLGWDFLSPGLVEADLMRRVLDGGAFADWLESFLPDVTAQPAVLDPVTVDSDDGVALHLVGLNLSRAWCLADLAVALDAHPYVEPFERSAVRHARRGLEAAFTDDYAGAHWLSSFALYLLTRNATGPVPG